jgi:LAO/AO transport system kinase
MQSHGGDAGVFIRSMASRGRLGGIARATGDAVALFDAAGFAVVIVETVGAGQGEVEIASAAHTTLVIEVPGMGDDVQSIKAGILEIADVFVVNKADREGADATVRLLRAMLHLGEAPAGGWTPPVIPVVALRDQGIAEVAVAAEQHLAHMRASGLLAARQRARAAYELRLALQEGALERARARVGASGWEALVDAVAARTTDPYTAAAGLLAAE